MKAKLMKWNVNRVVVINFEEKFGIKLARNSHRRRYISFYGRP